MPERLTSGAYTPDVAKLMGDALDRAWADFEPKPRNAKFARSLMATAIIERFETGAGDMDALVRVATVALISAIKTDPELLGRHPTSEG